MKDKAKKKILTHALSQNRHFAIVFFFSGFAWNFCVETVTVQVKQQFTIHKLGNYTTSFEMTLATQLMLMQLGLQTLRLAYFQSLELFSISQLYICVHFLQSTFPARQSAPLAGFQ